MQPFANTTILVGPNAPTCLSRGETKQATDQITVAMLDLCQGTAGTEYTQHRRCVEQRIHALMHEGIGPTMWLLATSPGDPVFFMHHGFVDWQWKRWQDVNGTRSTESKSSCSLLLLPWKVGVLMSVVTNRFRLRRVSARWLPVHPPDPRHCSDNPGSGAGYDCRRCARH
jgi:hypothetical protein